MNQDCRLSVFGRRDRSALIRQAFCLEWITVVWMAAEAAVAIASGVVAMEACPA